MLHAPIDSDTTYCQKCGKEADLFAPCPCELMGECSECQDVLPVKDMTDGMCIACHNYSVLINQP